MADSIFCISIVYCLLILFGRERFLNKFTVVPQFIICWLWIELAFFHVIFLLVLLVLTLVDLASWSFLTVLGVGLTAYTIKMLWDLHQESLASTTFINAVREGLGSDYLKNIPHDRRANITLEAGPTQDEQWKLPFSFKRDFITTKKNIVYGPNDRNTLDIHCPKEPSDTPRPVMLQIHGGGWIIGYGDRQALPLRNKLVEAGWIFVAINYRLSPKAQFPAHIVDCKQALVWIKENIAEYGGDPNFILATGGSAGGHLCSLLALTANRHQEVMQPGFEDADTSVQGCLPMYGVYDFCDSNPETDHMPFNQFLSEQKVMPMPLEEDRAFWEMMSPASQIQDDHPPFMVVNGIPDTLTLVENARFFVEKLEQTGVEPLVFAEVERAPHGFDIFYSPRCIDSVNACHVFAETLYSNYLNNK
jgi:acetyl esterase/lipase